MINFGDIKGLGDIEVTEPIAKAHAISQQAFQAGLNHIESSVREENAVMKQIAEELYKSGKVDFIGGSAPAFKKRYDTEKKKLVNELKSFSSVQSFLSNGGYEKIAEFKNNLENSDEYKNGVISKINFETYNHFKKQGVPDTKIKWANGNDIQKFMKGDTDRLEFDGLYNTNPIDPNKWVIDRSSDKTEFYTPEQIKNRMKVEGYNDEDIQLTLDSQLKNPTLYKTIRDDAKYAQIEASKANTALNNATKITMNDADNATKEYVANTRLNAGKNRSIKWNEFIGGKSEINEISFKTLPFFSTEKLPGFNPGIKDNVGEHDILVDGEYETEKGSKIEVKNKPNQIIERIPGKAKLDIKKQRWELPVMIKSIAQDGSLIETPDVYYKKINLNEESNKLDVLNLSKKGIQNVDITSDLNATSEEQQKVLEALQQLRKRQ